MEDRKEIIKQRFIANGFSEQRAEELAEIAKGQPDSNTSRPKVKLERGISRQAFNRNLRG